MNKITVQDIKQQYEEGRSELTTKKLRWVSQLILLNNLNRGDENIASTQLYTLFNRVLSNLYDDKIQVKFIPAEDGDMKKTELLNKLAINDYREMDKDKLDYTWLWDTLFFGRGYCETLRWDSDRKIMRPEIINPLYFIYDPFFNNPQEWRYYGKWVLRSQHQIQRLIDAGIIDGIKNAEEIPTGVESELWSYKVRVDSARQGNAQATSTVLQSSSGVSLDSPGSNALYQIYEHFTHDENGDRCIYWTDKNFSKILMKKVLNLKDGEEGRSKWPIVVKEAFKEAHSDLSLSLIDVIEDKHRALNVLYNLSYVAAKDDANPLYQYNPEIVKDVSQLFQRQVNQHIAVDDINSGIAPLNKNSALSQTLMMFINLIKGEMSDPLGTGVQFQPLKKGKQSATEAALQQQLNDMATSLQSKIIALSEKEFWSHWYQRIKHNTKDTDRKIMALISVKNTSLESFNFSEVKTQYPPGVRIFSSKEAEYKELVLRRDLMQLYPAFEKTLDPSGLKNFNKHIFFPKFLDDSSTVDLLLPDSLDEIKAHQENEVLADNKMINVDWSENDQEHLYVHNEGKNTPAMWAHRFWHEKQLALKKKQQEEMMMQQKNEQVVQNKPGNLGQYPTPNRGSPSNNEAAAPLKNELASAVGKIPQKVG